MKYLLSLILLVGCATSPKKMEPKPLSKSELKAGEVLVFGRYFNLNRRAIFPEDHLTYSIDDESTALTPNFEGKDHFFWMLVPAKTKKIHLKSITTKGAKYSSPKGDLAIAQITPVGQVPVYVGEILPTTDKVLKNVQFLASIRKGQNYLFGKRIAEGNFVLRKFESASGLKDTLNRIQENSP